MKTVLDSSYFNFVAKVVKKDGTKEFLL